MSQFGDEIKQAIEIFPSRKAASKKIGISAEYLRQLSTDFIPDPNKSLDTLSKLSKTLGIDRSRLIILAHRARAPEEDKHLYKLPSELNENIVPEKDKIYLKEHAIPVINYASCGKWEDLTDLDYPVGNADSYEYSDTKDPHAFFVKANGDSMTGSIDDKRSINSGDLLLVEPSMDVESGDIVLARDDSKGVTVKKFYKSDSQIILHPLNPKYEPIIVKNNITVYRISGKRTKW